MSDWITIKDSTGATVQVSADAIGAVMTHRMKVQFGVDGVATDVAVGAELPVKDANGNAIKADLDILAAAVVAGIVQVAFGGSLPAGTNNIGKVDINSVPASADTTDSVTASQMLLKSKQGLVDITLKRAFTNVAQSTTDATVIAAVSTKKLLVLGAIAICGGTATPITFNSKPAGAGTAISPLFSNGPNGGEVLPFSPSGWFMTNTSEGLSVTTGAGATTGILVCYGEVT